MRYVKLNRLNMVRKELHSLGSRTTLAQLADKYEFSNASRMVREYTELFGEAPRETAERSMSGVTGLQHFCTASAQEQT